MDGMIQRACQRFLLLVVVLFCLSACSRRYDEYPVFLPFQLSSESENFGVGRFKTAYLVEQIDEYYRGLNPGPIGVATFVNIDDLYKSSTFGRVYAEQVMSELAMRGFDVVELRHSDAMQFLADDGEFALSRDVSVLKRARDLGGIVVGTYAVSPVRVYVNARLIDPRTSLVHAAGSVEMHKSKEIAKLLRGSSATGSLERMPIRTLNNNSFPLAFNPAMMANRYEAEESIAPQPLFNGIQ